MATAAIDRMPLKGRPAEPTQENQFPRAYLGRGLIERQQYFEYIPGWWYEESTPQRVKDACCEQALFLLEVDSTLRDQLFKQTLFGVTEEDIGYAREIRSPEVQAQHRKGNMLSPTARELLLPYIARVVNIR